MALKKCKECGNAVSTKAKTCPSCGAPVKAETSPAAGCLTIIILFIGIAFFTGVFSGKNSSTPSSGTPTQPPATIPSVGDLATLRVAGGEDVLVAINSETFDRMTKLSVAKDTIGVTQLALAGLVWTVPSGTQVRIIDPGIFSSEVRIMSGDHFGKSCLVASDFMHQP